MKVILMSDQLVEAPKATHMTEFFLKGVELVVDQLCVKPQDLHPYVTHLAKSFLLNELELVAWIFILKRALYGESQERQLRTLQYSAYLAKTLMSRHMDVFERALNREEPQFQANYTQWLTSHPRCREINVRDLHMQYKDMWTRGKSRDTPENLNQVVDSIVQAKTEMKTDELELPLHGSFEGLTPNFPSVPLSGSFFLEEFSRMSRTI